MGDLGCNRVNEITKCSETHHLSTIVFKGVLMKKLALFSSLILASAGAFAETAKSDAAPAAPAKAVAHDSAKSTHAKTAHGKDSAAKSKSSDAKPAEVAPADKAK